MIHYLFRRLYTTKYYYFLYLFFILYNCKGDESSFSQKVLCESVYNGVEVCLDTTIPNSTQYNNFKSNCTLGDSNRNVKPGLFKDGSCNTANYLGAKCTNLKYTDKEQNLYVKKVVSQSDTDISCNIFKNIEPQEFVKNLKKTINADNTVTEDHLTFLNNDFTYDINLNMNTSYKFNFQTKISSFKVEFFRQSNATALSTKIVKAPVTSIIFTPPSNGVYSVKISKIEQFGTYSLSISTLKLVEGIYDNNQTSLSDSIVWYNVNLSKISKYSYYIDLKSANVSDFMVELYKSDNLNNLLSSASNIGGNSLATQLSIPNNYIDGAYKIKVTLPNTNINRIYKILLTKKYIVDTALTSSYDVDLLKGTMYIVNLAACTNSPTVSIGNSSGTNLIEHNTTLRYIPSSTAIYKLKINGSLTGCSAIGISTASQFSTGVGFNDSSPINDGVFTLDNNNFIFSSIESNTASTSINRTATYVLSVDLGGYTFMIDSVSLSF